jgi:hypothetical protein
MFDQIQKIIGRGYSRFNVVVILDLFDWLLSTMVHSLGDYKSGLYIFSLKQQSHTHRDLTQIEDDTQHDRVHILVVYISRKCPNGYTWESNDLVSKEVTLMIVKSKFPVVALMRASLP